MSAHSRRQLADRAALGLAMLRARAETTGLDDDAGGEDSTYELLLATVPWSELRASVAACGSLALADWSASPLERLLMLRLQQQRLESALSLVRMDRLVAGAADAVLGSMAFPAHDHGGRGTEGELFAMVTLVLSLIDATGGPEAGLHERLTAMHRAAVHADAGLASTAAG